MVVFLLIVNPNLFSQKNIYDYFLKAFPNGYSTEITITDTILDLENDFLEFSYTDGNFKTVLLQAKIFHPKKGNDILIVLKELSDMQCNYQKQIMFEIDSKNDSLIPTDFSNLNIKKGYPTFVNKDSIELKIFSKYTDSLKEYLQEDNNINQFMEELYDYKFELDSKNYLTVYLRFCDYIPTNIIGFTEKELEYLKNSDYHIYKFNNRKGNFKEYKGKVIVKF